MLLIIRVRTSGDMLSICENIDELNEFIKKEKNCIVVACDLYVKYDYYYTEDEEEC